MKYRITVRTGGGNPENAEAARLGAASVSAAEANGGGTGIIAC